MLRIRAAEMLAIEVDEITYMSAAQSYIPAFKNHSVLEIIENEINPEHPPLGKLVYTLVILPIEENPNKPAVAEHFRPSQTPLEAQFISTRFTSVIMASLAVLFLAIINPLAGLFYAIHAWQINFTSRVLLESLPSMTSILMVVFYLKSKQKWNQYLFLSSMFLGLTTASKYYYCLVGAAIIIDWL